MMKRLSSIVMSLALLAALTGSVARTLAADLRPALVPWPQTLKLAQGTLPLTLQSRIICQDPKLLPLANILAEEIRLTSGLKLAVVADKPGHGDIALAIDPNLVKEIHVLYVGRVVNQVDPNHIRAPKCYSSCQLYLPISPSCTEGTRRSTNETFSTSAWVSMPWGSQT